MAEKLPETKQEHKRPLCNTNKNRARGYALLTELLGLAKLRISRREILDWPTWGYCMAATILAVEPGRQRKPQVYKGVLLQSIAYAHWPDCDVRAVLSFGKPPLFPCEEAVPPEIWREVEKAVERARLSPLRGFMSGDALARFLKVSREEVECLGLRVVNGVDFTSADRRERRRQSSIQRKEDKRRQSGSIPRDEYLGNSVTRLAPWQELGISRASFYRKPKQERDELLAALRHSLSGKN